MFIVILKEKGPKPSLTNGKGLSQVFMDKNIQQVSILLFYNKWLEHQHLYQLTLICMPELGSTISMRD